MKLKSILSTGLLAALTTLSLVAQAASDTDKAATSQSAVADKTAKPDAKAEDKAGAPKKVAQAQSDKSNQAKDRKRHLHPRDGK